MASISVTSPAIGWFFASVLPKIIQRISDAVIDHCVLLKWLEAKGCIKYHCGGDGIAFPVRLTESGVGGATSDWGSRIHGTLEPPIQATESYRQFDWDYLINLWQLKRVSEAEAKSKLLNMAESEANSVRQEATRRLAQWLNGSGSAIDSADIGTVMNGLGSIITNTGTLHGISRTTYSAWQSQIDTVTNFLQDSNSDGVTNGHAAMLNMYMDCQRADQGGGGMDGSGVKPSVATDVSEPDLILTTQEGYEIYELSLEARHRFVDSKAGPITGLAFKNATVAWDRYVTANKYWFLNSDHIELWIVGGKIIEDLATEDMTQPYARAKKLGGQGNLLSRQPRYLGGLTYSGTGA